MSIRGILLALPCMFLSGMCSLASAQTPSAQPQHSLQRTAEEFLRTQSTGLPGQVSIEISKLPDTTRYANCTRWEAFLPAGARAWGRVSVGLRCLEGGGYSLYLSAKVRVDGSYLLAARSIANGQTITAEDLKVTHGELTAQAPDLLISATDAIGQTARTAIAAERPLQATLLRPQNVIEAGQMVKILMQGRGFTVSGEGQALTAAMAGQNVRLKLGNGNIVTAIARGKGVAELRN